MMRKVYAIAAMLVMMVCLITAFMIDDSENIAIYTDRECTKQATGHWDRMSDMTYYIKHTK